MDPNQPSPYPVQGGYVVQGGAPVQQGYPPQQQQMYAPQYAEQPVYAQQQPVYGHVVQPSQGYAPPPQSNVTYVQTTQTHGQPVEPQQTQVVVVHTKGTEDDDSKLVVAWVLFGLGWIFPILWCVGAMFVRARHPATRVAGILNLVFGLLTVVAVIVIPIVVVLTASAFI